jgi:hypothetical protein
MKGMIAALAFSGLAFCTLPADGRPVVSFKPINRAQSPHHQSRNV